MNCPCQLQKFTALLKKAIRCSAECANCGASYEYITVYALQFAEKCVVLHNVSHAKNPNRWIGDCCNDIEGCTLSLFLDVIYTLTGQCVDGLLHYVNEAEPGDLDGLTEYLESKYAYRSTGPYNRIMVKRIFLKRSYDHSIECVETGKTILFHDMKLVPITNTDCKRCLTTRSSMLTRKLAEAEARLDILVREVRQIETSISEDKTELAQLETLLTE